MLKTRQDMPRRARNMLRRSLVARKIFGIRYGQVWNMFPNDAQTLPNMRKHAYMLDGSDAAGKYSELAMASYGGYVPQARSTLLEHAQTFSTMRETCPNAPKNAQTCPKHDQSAPGRPEHIRD